jgi:chromosome segregation ATPase
MSLDTNEQIPEKEREEILQQIEEEVSAARISSGNDILNVQPKKRGILLPLLINFFAIAAVAAAVFVSLQYFDAQKEDFSEETMNYLSAEGRLIDEIRKETEQALAEKNKEIAQIQRELSDLDRQSAELQKNMEETLDAREAELRRQLEEELAAERERLSAQGISENEIEERLQELESQKSSENQAALRAFQQEFEEEIQQKEEEIAQAKATAQSILEQANEEVASLQAEADQRISEMSAQFEEERRALEEESSEAQASLQALSDLRRQEELYLQQILGSYRIIRQNMNSGNYKAAQKAIDDLRGLLNSRQIEALPSLAKQKESELFILSALEELIEAKTAGDETGTTALIDAAHLLMSARKKIGEADQAYSSGEYGEARRLYTQALNDIPQFRQAVDNLKTIEESAEKDILEVSIETAAEFEREGNTGAAVEQFKETVVSVSDNSALVSRAVDGIIDSLKRQEAERIAAREERIQDLETRLSEAQENLEGRNDTIAELRNRITALESTLRSRQAEISGLESEAEALQSRIDELEKAKQSAETRISGLSSDTEDLNQRIETLQEEAGERQKHIGSLEDTIAEREDQIESLKAELETSAEQITALENTRDRLQDSIKELNNTVAELKNQLDSSSTSSDTRISGLQSELSEAEAGLASAEEEITAIEKQIETAENTIAALETEKSGTEQSLTAARQELEKVKSTVQLLQQGISEKEAEISGLEDSLKTSTERISSLEEELRAVRTQAETTAAQLRELKAAEAARTAAAERLTKELENEYADARPDMLRLSRGDEIEELEEARDLLIDVFATEPAPEMFPGIANLIRSMTGSMIDTAREDAFEAGEKAALSDILMYLNYINQEDAEGAAKTDTALREEAESNPLFRSALREIQTISEKGAANAERLLAAATQLIGTVTSAGAEQLVIEPLSNVIVPAGADIVIKRKSASGTETDIALARITSVNVRRITADITRILRPDSPPQALDLVYLEELLE